MYLFSDHKKTEKDIKYEAERAESEGNYGKVVDIRYGKIKEAHERQENLQKQLQEFQSGNSLIKEEVTREDIAEVVSKWTGIPLNKMLESETQKLLQLEKHLQSRVKGQDHALVVIADAIRRARAEISDPNRPIGSPGAWTRQRIAARPCHARQ